MSRQASAAAPAWYPARSGTGRRGRIAWLSPAPHRPTNARTASSAFPPRRRRERCSLSRWPQKIACAVRSISSFLPSAGVGSGRVRAGSRAPRPLRLCHLLAQHAEFQAEPTFCIDVGGRHFAHPAARFSAAGIAASPRVVDVQPESRVSSQTTWRCALAADNVYSKDRST